MNELLDDKKRAVVIDHLIAGIAAFNGADALVIEISWKKDELTVGEYRIAFFDGYYHVFRVGETEFIDTAETLTYMFEVVLRDLANGLIDRFTERLRERLG
jgi:hypothetical protein